MTPKTFFLAFLVGLWVGPIASAAPAAEVELMLKGDQLEPSTTLEFRFAREMVGKDDLGVPAASPVAFEPALAGNFTWLSRRSGVFVPTAEPKMGASIQVKLLPGLKDAAGQPIGAGFTATLKTPPFAIVEWPSRPNVNLSSFAELKLAFNREIKLEGAEKLLRFVNGKGGSVPATVRYATKADYLGGSRPGTDPWEKSWGFTQKAAPEQEPAEEEENEDAQTAREKIKLENWLVLKPATALTPDSTWRLELAPGITAKTGGYRMEKKESWEIGSVPPFTINSTESSSYLNSGKTLLVSFTGAFAQDIDEETAPQYLKVTPAVPKLKYELNYRDVQIHGEFVQGTKYTLEIAPGLVNDEGLPFTGERKVAFDFGPVRPRVYLPEITGHQIMGGRRKFVVEGVNLKSLHVIARQVTDRVPQALAAFEKYNAEYDDKHPDERFQALAAAAIPGKVIFEKTYPLTSEPIDHRQDHELDWTEILGGVKAGVIFLTVEATPSDLVPAKGRVGAQALIQLTDLGMIWKKLDDRLQVATFSMATGAPLPGVKVSMVAKDFKVAQTVASDATGATSLSVPEEPGWVVARAGGDVHAFAIGEGAAELPMAAFHLPISYNYNWGQPVEAGEGYRTFLFTDRPLYKPGETVHVKGYVRAPGPQGMVGAAGRAATLVLMLPHGKGTREFKVKTDARGSFDADAVLDAYAVGHHSFSLKLTSEEAEGEGEEGQNQARGAYAEFQVAEFQPNAFELTVATPPRLAPGTPLRAPVSGKYFFGGTLTGSKLAWTLQFRAQPFAREGFELFSFGETDEEKRKSLTQSGEGQLSPTGEFLIQPKLPEATGMPSQGTLTVEVTDANQQTVAETKNIVRDSSAFYLGLRTPDDLMIGPKDVIKAQAVAVQPDGQPIEQPIAVQVELVRMKYNVVRAQGAGNAVTFHSEKAEEVVARAEGKTLVPQRRGEAWEVKAGETAKFTPGKTGEYKLRVKAKDAQGHEVVSAINFNVTGQDPAVWDYRHPSQVEMVTDKLEYHAGETARVMVKTPISGDAVISIEREGRVLRTMRQRLEGNAPAFEVPLKAGDAPNVFVSLILVRGAEQSTRKYKVPEYRYGVCQLHVVDPTSALKVSIETSTPKVQPGADVLADVAVTDANGAAVADAEVTFFAVDDGVLAITGYERPNPLPTFYRPLPLEIRTGITLFELMAEDPNDLEFGNKGYLIGGGGLEGPGPKLRQNFPGTAIWLPSIKTGLSGHVKVKFPAPDALTRYRLVAVANAGATRFGSGESSFTIAKPLILLSALGQAGHVGDQIVARAVLRNESGKDGEAKVTLELDEHAEFVGAPVMWSGGLEPGEAQTIDFLIRLKKTGTASWNWNATMNTSVAPPEVATSKNTMTLDDALAVPFRIEPAAPILRETYLTDLAAKTSDLLAGVNPQLTEGTGEVRVTLSNTRLASLQESAESLLHYPYGCAEQQLSSLVPWILTRDMGPMLPEFRKTAAERAAVIRRGAQKLFTQQTYSGGISYWPGGAPSVFASAYAVVVLSMLEVNEKETIGGWDKLIAYLGKELRGIGTRHDVSLEDYALALYALALVEASEPAYIEQLYHRADELSPDGRAFLACAVLQMQGQPAMVAKLLNGPASAEDTFSWFGSPTRERAVKLMAWSQYKPADKEVGRLVKEILAARVNGHWRTTQENAWAMLGLARYFTKVEKEVKPVSGQLVRADKPFAFALTKAQKTKQLDFPFDPEKPLGKLETANPQKAPLYGEATFLVEPPVSAQPRQDRGYAVSRSYRKLLTDGTLKDAKDLQVGDRVVVTVRVTTAAPGHFVAIDDPLPGILEALNPEFKTQAVAGGQGLERTYGADYREIRADRVLYFCDHLPAGTYNFQYLARVRIEGDVIAPATKVEEMYRPERFGLSAVEKLKSGGGR